MIIFDLDGTLYQTHITCLAALEQLSPFYGLRYEPEDAAYLLYTSLPHFLDRIAPHMTLKERLRLHQEFHQCEIALMHEKGELFEGVLDMLCQLKARDIPLAICSMGSIEYIQLVLERFGIASLFDHIYPRQEGRTKSQVLAQLIADTHVTKSDCIMVGDSITDFAAAQDNQIPFIGVSYGYGAKDIVTPWMADSVSDLSGLINQAMLFPVIYSNLISLQTPMIVGINGVDTSGKTVFATRLEQYLKNLGHPTQLIHIDDFHNPRAFRNQDASHMGYLHHTFDLDTLADLLDSIRQSPIDRTLCLLDLDTDAYTHHVRYTVGGRTIVIVEGSLLFRPPIDCFFDYTIYLNVGFDKVLERAMRRDVPKYGEEIMSRYRSRYIPAQKRYIEQYNPDKRCDMHIDNNDYSQPRIIHASKPV